MIEEKLRKRIATKFNKEVSDALDGKTFCNPTLFGAEVLALVKEAGYIQVDANAQLEYWDSQFDKFAKARGYVKLVE